MATILLAAAAWIALTGGGRYIVFGAVLSLRSPLLFVYAAGAVLAVRHLVQTHPTAVERLRRLDGAIAARPAFAAALRPFVATRLMVFVVAFFAVVTFGFPAGREGVRVSNDPLRNLPARYDAGWYGSIALEGYSWGHTFGRQQDIAFFPALPLLARGVGAAFGAFGPHLPRPAQMERILWAAVLISCSAFLWGLHYFVRLAREMIGPERAADAALLLAAYPFALFYNAAYTEGLFLLGAAGASFHFLRGQWVAASCFGLLAGLSRPNGCFLSVPLAILAWEHVRRSTAGGAPWRPLMLRLVVAAMPGIGMLIYTVYLQQLTGVWFAWARSHAAWGRTFQGGAPISAAIERLTSEPLMQVIGNAPYEALNSIGLLFALLLAWPVFRHVGAAWAIFVIVNIAPPLAAGGVLSMGRLTSTLFPLFLALAVVLPPRAVAPCAAAFAVMQGLLAALFFTWRDLY